MRSFFDKKKSSFKLKENKLKKENIYLRKPTIKTIQNVLVVSMKKKKIKRGDNKQILRIHKYFVSKKIKFK